jgi:hypothetical protein
MQYQTPSNGFGSNEKAISSPVLGLPAPAYQLTIVECKTIGESTQRGRKPQSLETTLKHNLRLIKAEGLQSRYNPTKSPLNTILAGATSPQHGRDLLNALFDKYLLHPKRQDYVQAIELLVTAPPCLNHDTATQYLSKANAWAANYYGHEMVISAIIHADEAALHLHLLIAPITIENGKARLNGSSLTKATARSEALKSFNQHVAHPFGLHAQSFEEYKANATSRQTLAKQVTDYLIKTNAPETVGKLWAVTQSHLKNHPEPYAKALGLSQFTSMGALAASTGKGERLKANFN